MAYWRHSRLSHSAGLANMLPGWQCAGGVIVVWTHDSPLVSLWLSFYHPSAILLVAIYRPTLTDPNTVARLCMNSTITSASSRQSTLMLSSSWQGILTNNNSMNFPREKKYSGQYPHHADVPTKPLPSPTQERRVAWWVFRSTPWLFPHYCFQKGSYLGHHHWFPGVHRDWHFQNNEMQLRCRGHQKHLHSAQPEATVDRGSLQTLDTLCLVHTVGLKDCNLFCAIWLKGTIFDSKVELELSRIYKCRQ